MAGKPILQHQVENAVAHGFHDIIMLTRYKEDVIKNYFGNGQRFGVNIEYVTDEIPLGTAGSVKALEAKIKEPFIVFYGDTIMDVNLTNLVDYHFATNGLATLVVHPNDHPHDSDLLEVDDMNRVVKFHAKPHPSGAIYQNLVNAALYALNPEIFQEIERDTYADFGRNIFPDMVAKNLPIYVYKTTEYIKDIGTINRLKEVEADFLSGKITKMNKKNKQKAIFLDRDGVINEDAEPVNSPEKFRFLPDVTDAIKKINESNYLSIIVTNQPMIAKGFATESQLREVHKFMETRLGGSGAYIDRIYYCPHHPEKGHKGENKDLKIICSCRKPGTGMLERAAREMNIDLGRSFIIGDRAVDILAGKNAGTQTILVSQESALSDEEKESDPDEVFNNLYEAVNFILADYEK